MPLASSFSTEFIEAGCDEAGRGCLAGPVYAAAVIFDKGYTHPLFNDSKKMTEKQRYEARAIIEKEAKAWAVAHCSPTEIDAINILNASFQAMHRAIAKLPIQPELLLIDGNRFKPYPEIPFECIIKGDGKYLSIAAASILAKTYRDDYMRSIAADFPAYDWASNKGYPTKKHRSAVLEHGPTVHHRKSFRVTQPVQGKLF